MTQLKFDQKLFFLQHRKGLVLIDAAEWTHFERVFNYKKNMSKKVIEQALLNTLNN